MPVKITTLEDIQKKFSRYLNKGTTMCYTWIQQDTDDSDNDDEKKCVEVKAVTETEEIQWFLDSQMDNENTIVQHNVVEKTNSPVAGELNSGMGASECIENVIRDLLPDEDSDANNQQLLSTDGNDKSLEEQLSHYIKVREQEPRCFDEVDKEIAMLIGGSISNSEVETEFNIVQDAGNPHLFYISPASSNNVTNISGQNQIIVFGGQPIQPSQIVVKDILVKNSKSNPLKNGDFFIGEKMYAPRVTKRLRRKGVDNKSMAPKKRQLTKKERSDRRKMRKANQFEICGISLEVKNVSNEEWVRLSAQEGPDTIMDENDLHQSASLPIITDMEDDVFNNDSTFTDIINSIDSTESVTLPYASSELPGQNVEKNSGVDQLVVNTNNWTNGDRNTDPTNGSDREKNGTAENYKTSLKSSTSQNANPSTELCGIIATPLETGQQQKEQAVETVQLNPVLMDWKSDTSTDLDYEPFEDEEEPSTSPEPERKTYPRERSTSIEREPETIHLDRDTSPEPEPITPRNSIVIDVPNDSDSIVKLLSRNHTDSSTATQSEFVTMRNNRKPITPVPPLPDALKQPASAQKTSLQLEYLFNRPCYRYMNDKKCRRGCKNNHTLPPSNEVFQKLMLFPDDSIKSIYTNFIVKNRLSFCEYFSTFCEVFGKRKMEDMLLESVEYCEHYGKMSFYMDIYQGLIKMDVSKLDALSKIGEKCCNSRAAYANILNIIVKEDPLFCITMLQKYYPLATIQTQHMLNLIYHVMGNPTPSLLRISVEMFDKYSVNDECEIDVYKTLLIEIRSLVADDVVLSERLEEISSKKLF